MADKPVTEVVQVDAVLDGLSSPTSSDVYEALQPYSNDAVAAVAAKRAAAGGGSSPIRVETVDVTFEDFTVADEVAESGYLYAEVYELQPDEHLLFTVGRVTEEFDDSTADVFNLMDGHNADTSDAIGLSSSNNLGPGPATPANGLVALVGGSVGTTGWNKVDQPYTPDTVAVQLYLKNSFVGDGAAGALTLWLYIGTP